MKNLLLKGVGIFGTVAFLLSSSSVSYANLEGPWIQHPAASLRGTIKESQVDRIIEGDRYVYFSVRGSEFNRANGNAFSNLFKVDPLQIFIYDKTSSWTEGCIRPLAQEYSLSGIIPVAIGYSPTSKVLALAYENRMIDFVYENGVVISSAAISDLSVPKQTVTPYSFTFDEERGKAYVAGSYGLVTLDMKTGELEDVTLTDKPVSWGGRVGDKIVMFAGDMTPSGYNTKTYVYDPAKGTGVLDAPLAGGDNLQALMPLTDDSFAALAPGGNDAVSSLKVFTLSGNSLQAINLADGITVDGGSSSNYRHMFRTDGYVLPAKDGFAVYGNANIYLLKKGSTNLNATISRGSSSATEKNSKASTYDGTTIWLYSYENAGNINSDPRGFYSYKVEGENWKDKSSVLAPNAPTETFANFGQWVPGYGLILRGPGTSYSTGATFVDNLCSFDGFSWRNRAFIANNPTFMKVSESSRYAVSDPLHPSQIWGTNTYHGMNRIDMEDYSTFRGLGGKHSGYNNYPNIYPGFHQAFNMAPGWSSIAQISNVDFDNNGTMWMVQFFPPDAYYDYEDISDSKVPFYYLTAEEREKLDRDNLLPSDFTSRELKVDSVNTYHFLRMIVMKSKGNDTRMAAMGGYIESDQVHFVIYDHNGTLSDKTDDRYAICKDLFDENGDRIMFRDQSGLYEDPVTGYLWLLTSSGPFIVDTSKLLDGDKTVKRLNIIRFNGVETSKDPLENVTVNYISDDNLGRKWLASESGLYCLSATSEEILGHYTTDNSGLPSDHVLNVVCSPSGVVFAMTERGLAEFRPEGSIASIAAGNHLSIYPSSLRPDYKGYVNIKGAESGSEYVVYNQAGEEVVSLGKTDDGFLQWLPSGLNAGRYNIARRGINEHNPIIILD